MPYVDATGAKLYFEDNGDGYPIIFVHEFGHDIRQWQAQVSRAYRCIAYNARGYPPSDVPDDAALYGREFAVDDIAAVMRHLSIERAYVVGLSMGGYAAPQFGLRHPDKISAIVAAAVGSGSLPSQRDAWLKETSVLSRIFSEHGMRAMAERMARCPGRIQLKYKDRKTWQDFVEHLRELSAKGMSNTMARCQALRPTLHDLRDELSGMTIPVLLAVGEEDVPCLETNLMLKSSLPNAGLWICPNTGHAINLEEPGAFNAHVESFLSSVAYRRRGSQPDRIGLAFVRHGDCGQLGRAPVRCGCRPVRRRGVGPQALLGFVATVSITAQLALILRWPLPSYFLWTIVTAVGAATVLSYTILAEHFPKELAGRANGLLNFFHIGAAFVVQTATGLVLQHWPPDAGHYPEIAYQIAFALNLALQIVAGGLVWASLAYTLSRRNLRVSPNVQRTCKIRQVSLGSVSGCVRPFFNGRLP